jgi:hypothetical protein
MYIVMLAKVQRLPCSVKAVAIEKVLQGAFAATFLIACVAAAIGIVFVVVNIYNMMYGGCAMQQLCNTSVSGNSTHIFLFVAIPICNFLFPTQILSGRLSTWCATTRRTTAMLLL